MNEINQLYQKHVEHELTLSQPKENALLHKDKVEIKILAFLSDLGNVADQSQCFSFWDKYAKVDSNELKEAYINGLQMLLSIGFELHVDALKNQVELENNLSLPKQFLKVYESVLKIKTTFNFEDYQNSIEDYFSLGAKLGFSFEDILAQYQHTFR